MKIGIDFGTSYTAAAVVADDQVQLVQFPSGPQFRTAAYFPTLIPSIDDFALTPVLERQLDEMIAADKREANAAYTLARRRWTEANRLADPTRRAAALALVAEPVAPNDTQIRRAALRRIRQQWLEEQARLARGAITDTKGAVLGDAAIDEYILEGSGHIIQSPKSMLGYDLAPRARETVLNVVGYILEEIRRTATRQLGAAVRHAVIGRPVEFRSSLGEAGSRQALDIITEAATQAGFDEVSFLPEPIAASFGLHRDQAARLRTLIVDVGGGTTDFAYVELGGNHAPVVLGSWGLPMGGTDVDLVFAQEAFMPLFGRNQQDGAPAHHYVEAMMVHDQIRQRQFLRYSYKDLKGPFGPRMTALQRAGNTHRTARAVEDGKIRLSDTEVSRVDFGYIEEGLMVEASRPQLLDAFEWFGRRFDEVLQQVARDIGTSPDLVYLTGGMSRAPYVVARVRARFPESRSLHGDASFGVVRGLAVHAAL